MGLAVSCGELLEIVSPAETDRCVGSSPKLCEAERMSIYPVKKKFKNVF
jgi:hypothetical protein